MKCSNRHASSSMPAHAKPCDAQGRCGSCSWGSSTPHMGAIFFSSLKDGAKPALPEGIFQIRSNVPRRLMVVTAIRICGVWHCGFSDVPRPLSIHTNKHTHSHTATPGLLRWIECAPSQWAFDAKTIEGLPVLIHIAIVCVCEGVAIWGPLCQGLSAPGLVDNGVLGGWKSDVQVSRGLEIWPPFTYCAYWHPRHRYRHTIVLTHHTRAITEAQVLKSSYTPALVGGFQAKTGNYHVGLCYTYNKVYQCVRFPFE